MLGTHIEYNTGQQTLAAAPLYPLNPNPNKRRGLQTDLALQQT